ncbi:MAG: alanine and proline-rich secreted protein Apa [Myxococcota bacterium]|nr:alanine and proline-rich secreted protein Apa [Myxococcota bacterium]
MRADARAPLLALVTLALAACAHLRPVGEPRSYRVIDGLPVEHVRAIVLRGLAASAFQIDEETPGAIRASSHMRDASVQVVVFYDASAYTIAYADSTGLGAEVDGQGRLVLDRRYHRIAERLGTQITHAQSTTPVDHAAAASSLLPVPSSYAGATWGGSTAPGAPTIVAPTAPPHPAIVPLPQPVQVAPRAPNPEPVALAHTAQLPSPPAIAPLPGSERRATVAREPIHALVAVGAVLIGAGWIANWGVTLAISTEEVMIGESFIPLVGPFAQLGELRWDVYGRWTGAWYPIAGVIQIAGLIIAVVGQTVRLPVREPRSGRASGFGRSWMIAPGSVAGGGAGLSIAGSF